MTQKKSGEDLSAFLSEKVQVVDLIKEQLETSIEWRAIKLVHRMGQSRSVLVCQFLVGSAVLEQIAQLIAEKRPRSFFDFAIGNGERRQSVCALTKPSTNLVFGGKLSSKFGSIFREC